MNRQTHDEGPSAAWGWGEENPPRSRSVTNKVATILKAFAGQSGRTMTEVAQDACLPASTAYRLLQELVSCGVLQRGADGHYHIGPAVYQLATDSCSPADDAQAHIGQILQDLELVTEYRARFGVLRGRGVGYVERGGGPPDWLRPAPAVGPAHATAAGQALLAHAGAKVVERVIHRGLPRYTSRTPVTPDELHQALSVVRKCEIAVTRGEWKETLCAIAAPVICRADVSVATRRRPHLVPKCEHRGRTSTRQ
jgi:DNA-binding IclR family transcriptional regulator